MRSNVAYATARAVLVAGVLCLASFNVAAQESAKATEVASVEGITEYELPNGLRFLLFPDQSKQQITVNITYLVGSRHEGYGETGMAHLLEHLLFKGTPNHPDIPAELTERGAFPNGTTWLDRTNYFETFPANDDNLVWALDLEADRMVNSYVAKDDLDSEMTVVRNEMERGENSPFNVLQARIASAAYLWHNYGNSTIGARADVENVPIDRLQAFYRKYYQPDNAVLVVAGRFEPARAIEIIEEKFGVIPRPNRTGANQLFETYTAEPAQDGERIVTLRRVGDYQLAMAAYHIPAGSHEEYPAVQVLAHLLTTRPAGRLYKNVVEPGLAASTAAFSMQFREPGLLLAMAQVREEDDLDAASDAMLATLHGIVEAPPTDEEVNRAATEYASSFDLAYNNPQSIALQLSEWAAMGDWRLMFLHRDRVAAVTTEDVLAAAEKYLKTSNRTMGFFYPTKEAPARAEVPPPPDVTALVADYKGREALAEGEAFDPTPENIERRTTRVEVADGIRAALLPKENRGDAVTIRLIFRHGTEDELLGKSTAASYAGALLMRGTEKRSRQEISDEFDRLKIQGGVGGGVTAASIGFTTVRENLPAALRLGAEILREPAFDENEFELLREEYLAGIEAQRSEPQSLANNALSRHLSQAYGPDHIFYVATFDEQVERHKAVTLPEVRSFWSTFYGAGHVDIAVVGDFDPDETVALIRELFAGWHAEEPYERVATPYRDLEAVAVDIETPDKANAIMYATQRLRLRDDHPDYPGLVVGNYMLGGGFLNSRLAVRIRQNEGLSYGVGSQFSAGSIDEVGGFGGYAIFAPENADKVVAAFKEEVASALESGFTEDEVEAAKKGLLDSMQNGRSSDTAVAGILQSNLFLGRTMEFTAKREAAIAALTPDAILAAMRRHIDLDKLSIFRGGDFANKLAQADGPAD